MVPQLNLSARARKEAFREIDMKSDRTMIISIGLYFIFGLFLAFFYNTFFIAISIGGVCLISYFVTRYLLPESRAHQYVASAVLAVFSAQFIYQMHGLFEMHFFFFVGSALLITYRNWRLMIPLLLITVIHHATFAWLQYTGMKEIYFTQLDYMDLQSFIFHALLSTVIMSICSYWAYDLERTTLRDAAKSLILSKQVVNVENNIEFARQMSEGNLEVAYNLQDDSDALGKSLMILQENLKQSNARELEEKFITVGITKISDIIRHHSDDPGKLADEFIRGIVKYVGLNQGALFLSEEEEGNQHLSLAACYAYERKKYREMRINPGEGMVGQAFLEKEAIYITQVPADYVRITSGLGDATPRCILVVPVKTQDEVVGVIEVASFRTLKSFEKQFIHQAAENIASAVISSRATERIRKLLEDSQHRAEELRSHEEEMRQNMEELSATQEEMDRKAVETENRINAIEESGIASIEFALDGTIITANKHFLQLMGYTLAEVEGKHHRIFVEPGLAASQEYLDFWDDLRNGMPRPGEYKRVVKTGATVYIKGSYSIVRDRTGRPTRILKLASDITPFKLQEEQLQKTLADLERSQQERQMSQAVLESTMNAVAESIAVIEFTPGGEILTANQNFLKLMNCNLTDIEGKHHGIFVLEEEQRSQSYRQFWKDLAQGKTVSGEFNHMDRSGKPKWIRGTYSPIIRNGKVDRIMKIAYDISEFKKDKVEGQFDAVSVPV